MKEKVKRVKEVKAKLETLYATKFDLEQKGENSEENEDKIFELETEKGILEEEIEKNSFIKMEELKDVKTMITAFKKASTELETLYATKFDLEQKGKTSEEVEDKIFELEVKKGVLKEEILKKSALREEVK